jgi:hypothetical protein
LNFFLGCDLADRTKPPPSQKVKPFWIHAGHMKLPGGLRQ